MSVLITGGAGYIGSHTAIELLKNGYDVVIVDNLSNSKKEVVTKIEKLSNKDVVFYEADIRNKDMLNKIFLENKIDSVIHFASLKAVGESVEKPFEYYSNNLEGTLNLMTLMRDYNVNKLVFSSSATVYGNPHTCPILEEFPLSTTNPYGRIKLVIEDMLRDITNAEDNLHIAILRYFNPIGAHKSGEIGEEPNGIPNNIMPYIAKVATGEFPHVNVFGNDYDTLDGTGVRDYIHVVDLAKGHLKALEKLEQKPRLVVYNLGTGRGYSVLELIETMRNVTKKEIPYVFKQRRDGDIAVCYADPSKAERELGWKAVHDLQEMCEDSWRWESKNCSSKPTT